MLYIFPMIPKVFVYFFKPFFSPLFLGNLDKLGSLYWFTCEYTNSSNISIMLSSLSSELFNSGIMFFSSNFNLLLFKNFSFSVVSFCFSMYLISVYIYLMEDGVNNGNHSSVLAWRIPGTVEPGGLPSMGSHGVGHD